MFSGKKDPKKDNSPKHIGSLYVIWTPIYIFIYVDCFV
jgi:hypothetical protein